MDDMIRPFIADAKRELRSGQDVAAAFAKVKDGMRREVEAVLEEEARTGSAVPQIDFAAVKADKVSAGQIDHIRRRGAVVIRGVFPQARAEAWNEEIGAYIADNDYLEKAQEKSGMDKYFDNLEAGRPQIYGLYWSKPQIMARQAEEMAETKRFLNRLWDVRGPVGDEFDPDNDYSYADRTRRRQPGDSRLGLSPHMDAGSYERWVDPAFRKIYEPIFAGDWTAYDPWKATYRTQTREYASPAVCSMFRSFQGWTALTTQGPNDGTLQLVPIASGIAHLLLRALQPDVPADELCGAEPGKALCADPAWHADLLEGLVSIPKVDPGDTVWWHPDLIHAVEDVHNGQRESNVIYVGASPRCAKNEAYARKQASRFLAGESAPDFAAENYEVDFKGRATLDDLTELGRAQMAL